MQGISENHFLHAGGLAEDEPVEGDRRMNTGEVSVSAARTAPERGAANANIDVLAIARVILFLLELD